MPEPIINISGYKFIQLAKLATLQHLFKHRCLALGLKGTILLSPEGINVNLAGSQEAIDKFIAIIAANTSLNNIVFKQSYSKVVPFQRLRVKLKKEVISMDYPLTQTPANARHTLSPNILKQWLDEKRDFTLLDTRNDYEIAMGSFKQAKQLGIPTFKAFPSALAQNKSIAKDKPIVIFCTGGIRCEKALPYMQSQGFTQVYQLEGGILNYFAQQGATHYRGDCFVFDDRVALDPELKERNKA